MKLLSIDPGTQTGVAIAHVIPSDKEVQIVPISCDVYPIEFGGLEQLIDRHPDIHAAVMESMAPIPSAAGRESWHRVEALLLRKGLSFRPEFKKVITLKGIAQIGPGEWKPVMKASKLKHFGGFSPSTPHEKDAVMLLHYWVRSNYTKKQVVYHG